MIKKTGSVIIVTLWLLIGVGCESFRSHRAEKEAIPLIMTYEQELMPMERCIASVCWDVARGEGTVAYQRLERLLLERSLMLSNKEEFAKIKNLYKGGHIHDPYLKKQIEKLYFVYAICQVDSALLKRVSSLEGYLRHMAFSYEPEVNRKKMSLWEVENLLSTSTHPHFLKAAWKAEKGLGVLLRDSLVALVKCRNQMAHAAGFKDFYHYKIASKSQQVDSLNSWFNYLDKITRKPYLTVKQEVDTHLASLYGCKEKDLKVWHYQSAFFQEALNIYDLDQERSYKQRDVAHMANWFYTGLGFDLSFIYASSDLRYRGGKPHLSCCLDMDRRGDIRLVCNLSSDLRSMNEILRQSAYALYLKNISKSLPLLLRDISNPILYEGIALLFRRLPSNGAWLQSMGITRMVMGERIDSESYLNFRAQQLIFSRWSQVMFRFERSLYECPDQDLNKLWWSLVSEYQQLPIPQDRDRFADWATKQHLVISPCYYHNYLLGEVMASELNAYICDSIIEDENYWAPDYVNRDEVGKFLREKIFWFGDALSWQDILQSAIHRPFSFDPYRIQIAERASYDSLCVKNRVQKEQSRRKFQENKY